MQQRKQFEEELREALERLETTLETPRVPGELPGWVANVREALETLQPLLQRQIEEVHTQDLEQIEEEDSGLLRRVEQMRAEDTAIAEEFAKLSREVERLQQTASELEPDEARIADLTDQFAERGVQFVIRVRTQETSITTWLLEALERDRGPVD